MAGDAHGIRSHAVVGVPGPVAVVVVPRHERGPIVHKSDHRVGLVAVVDLANPDLIAQCEAGCRHDFGTQEVSQALALGHGGVEDAQHLVEVVLVLLDEALVGRNPLDNTPAFDDVDAVVAGVHPRVGGVSVDAHRARASEEVSGDLGEARPSVAVGARSPVALQLAVAQQRLDRIASAVPVQVQPDLSLRRGDDCSASHDAFPFCGEVNRLVRRPEPVPEAAYVESGWTGRC